jgi:plasmid stabilization system protein ParE
MTVRFTTVARRDFAEALEFFEGCNRGSSAEFIDDLERNLGYLNHFPLSGRGIGSNVRVLPVGVFPHKLVYLLRNNEIAVLAITDKERPPEFWINRAFK